VIRLYINMTMMRKMLLAAVIALTGAVSIETALRHSQFAPNKAVVAERDDVCRPPAGHAFWIFICNEESYGYSGAAVNPAYFCFNTSDPDETRVWLQFNAAHHATQGTNALCSDPVLRQQITTATTANSWATPQALADNLLLTVNKPGWIYVVAFGDVTDCSGAHCVSDDNCCVVSAVTANQMHAQIFTFKVTN